MFSYYKKASVSVFALLILSFVAGYIAIDATFLRETLLPSAKTNDEMLWQAKAYSDALEGGASEITIIDDNYSYSFSTLLVDQVEYPFAIGELEFIDQQGRVKPVDLHRFNTVSFTAKCSPESTLTFALYTIDHQASIIADERSDRISTRYFHCVENWQEFTIDLNRLETPEWWYKWYNQELSQQEYQLEQVVKMSFGSSIQSPKGVRSSVSINSLEVHGRDWFYSYAFAIFCVVCWVSLGIWLFKQHTKYLMAEVKQKLQKDRPLIAYKQLSIESHKDKDKSSILKFMATEYADEELNLESMVQKLGINRNKINEILKQELGYTFSAYLNKLRLNEAARLLAENEDSNVSEIAYSVGYKNVPYFNKLFKNEYGCSPKLFKNSAESHSEN